MGQFKEEQLGTVGRIARNAVMVVFAVMLVAAVGVVTLTHADLLSDSAGSEVTQSAVALRGPLKSEAGGSRVPDGSDEAAEETGAAGAHGNRRIATAWAAEVIRRVTNDSPREYAERFGISLALARDIHRIALNERIDLDVAFGLVRTESSFRPHVVSWAGAVGLTQLLPSTANWIVPGTHRSELFDTEINLRVGFRYLRHLMEKYSGNERLALLAYNRGPGTVDGILRRGGDPSNGYAAKVLAD